MTVSLFPLSTWDVLDTALRPAVSLRKASLVWGQSYRAPLEGTTLSSCCPQGVLLAVVLSAFTVMQVSPGVEPPSQAGARALGLPAFSRYSLCSTAGVGVAWEQVPLFPAALSGDSAHGDREPRVGGCSLWTGAASSLSWDAGGVSVQIPKTLLFKAVSVDFLE